MWKIALSCTIVAVACLVIALRLQGRPTLRRALVVLAALFAAGALWAHRPTARVPQREAQLSDVRPIEVAGDGDAYASSRSCRQCHAAEYQSWQASYHRTMTQLATPESVLGDFNNYHARVYGLDVRLLERDGEYWAQMQDPEQPRGSQSPVIQRPIVMTTGSHHMQVYWYATGKDRRLGQLPLVWLREDQRWVPFHSIFIRPPQESAGKNEARWNNTCVKCHTTQGRPRIDLAKRHVDTHVAEFGIACEACHGPGAAHVAAQRATGSGASEQLAVSMVVPSELDHQRSTDVCGQCHGVWTDRTASLAAAHLQQGMSYRPGDRLADTRHIFGVGDPVNAHVANYLREDPRFREDHFWSDGMVRVSGREYNGVVRSPCFQGGSLSCLSCHELHPEPTRVGPSWANDQLAPQMDTNQACVSCHPQLADREQLVAHTHHAEASSGSVCYNCHMPHTTYGLLKAIRSHQISSPRTQETVSVGRPNACNLCHADKTLPWTASHLASWYGIEVPSFSPQQQQVAATLLAAAQGDAGQRALAAASLGWQPMFSASRSDWIAPVLGQLLTDPYDAVRYVAYRALRKQDGFEDFDFDFLGDASYRRDRSRAVYQAWRDSAPQRSADSTLLISASGDLLHEEFLRLLEARDDRVVVLAE